MYNTFFQGGNKCFLGGKALPATLIPGLS